MTLEGKGFFIWKIPLCENGDANAIANWAAAAGLSHVLLKIADGIYSYNIDWENNIDLVPPVVSALKAKGITCYGWHYIYGYDPVNEAKKAIQRVKELGLDGYVLDAEAQYKEPGKAAAAVTFMNYLKAGIPNTPTALSSYRYPSYHPQLPWDEFLSRVDYNMPQVYWMFATNPGEQLTRSVQEFAAMEYNPPIVPTGAAFREHGWQPTAEQDLEFLLAARSLNLSAANFWEWSSCRLDLPTDVWATIAGFDWEGAYISPTEIAVQYISALNSHDPVNVMKLYNDNAVHISSARTLQGKDKIFTWYFTLLKQLLPGGVFTLTGHSGTGNSRHLTWIAKSDKGDVMNGNDTLGMLNGKIIYHYTYFTILK